MSLSFAGLGLFSFRRPDLFHALLAKFDFQSIFLMAVFIVVFCVLAYLTNPSESSFRAYLTELSFRQHLSRLDDSIEDPLVSADAQGAKCHPSATESCSPLHFANCVNLSLRTPKHVFHSFGLFTIAAIAPVPKAQDSTGRSVQPSSDRADPDRDGSVLSDSWFIGAFGKWWRGGTLETWYHDMLATSKDEECWNPGILCFNKASDKLDECPGLPFTTKSIAAACTPPQTSPKRLRHRERPSHRASLLPNRSTTPPLPKSVSLPLHSTRPLPSVNAPVIRSTQSLPHAPQPISKGSESQQLVSLSPSRQPSAVFDHSPQIAEVMRQISSTKSAVLDLRIQLTDAQTAASGTHLALESEVEACREHKRQEDAARQELKSRTKALEDSKRQAESIKREAEKKLKATQHARDDAQQRIMHLDKEISQLRQRLIDDQALVQTNQEEIACSEDEIAQSLELKRREAKVAEDVVAALNLRARDLEDKLVAEKERLRLAKEQVELRKQDRSFYPLHVVNPQNHAWPSLPLRSPPLESTQDDPPRSRRPSSPRPIKLSLNGISNFDGFSPSTNNGHANIGSGIANGYAIFDEDLAPLRKQQPALTNFSPFDDELMSPAPLITPTSSLIPSSLVSDIDGGTDGLSRSFQSESDVIVGRDWSVKRHLQQLQPSFDNTPTSIIHSHSTTTSSPTSLSSGPFSFDQDGVLDQFGPMPQQHNQYRKGRTSDNFDFQRMDDDGAISFSHLHRSNSDPTKHHMNGLDATSGAETPPSRSSEESGRRWFTSRDKPKKGLNPDAKEFSLSTKPLTTTNGIGNLSNHQKSSSVIAPPLSNAVLSSFDALNPNGIRNITLPPTNSSFLRAFAPSPAEREVLQRALGGSTNASFECLPSLSDVGSIPSSPTHVPAVVAATTANGTAHNPVAGANQDQRKGLPHWLQALSSFHQHHQRKHHQTSTFSPWNDDEPELDIGSGQGGKGVIGAGRRTKLERGAQ